MPTSYSLTLHPVPPFRLELTAWALRRRPENQVDRWDGQAYRRALVLGGRPCQVCVCQHGPPDAPELHVMAPDLPSEAEPALRTTLDRLLGLSADLADFYRLADADPELRPLAERFRGFKPPRFPSLFEAVAAGIACQQITLTFGIRLLNALCRSFGPSLLDERGFPEPSALVGQPLEALRGLGFSQQKARALLDLAAAIVAGRLDQAEMEGLDNGAAHHRLVQLRGVGRWTADYGLLRGLGRWDVFPWGDAGARNNLGRWLKLDAPLSYDQAQARVARWHPYGGLIYFYLLLDSLSHAGWL